MKTSLYKLTRLQLEKYCPQHLLGHTRLPINNLIPTDHLECFGWDYQDPTTVYMKQIILSSIGKDVSHGYIRMFNDDVLELSSSVPISTGVSIHK